MTEAEFASLREVLKRGSGLDLGPEKRYLAESRLDPVWRAAGLGSLSALVQALRAPSSAALVRAAVDAMATHETTFFRDRAAFEALRDVVLPRLIAARSGARRLRIWSAAASTGQEAYSLAMMLAELAPRLDGWRTTILATDLSGAAVSRARAGRYSQFEVQRGLPIRALLRHFRPAEDGGWSVSDELGRAVEFRVHNLLHDFTTFGTFDLVLCRNVLIYLDGPTKASLLDRLAAALAPDGLLLLGTSESALGRTAKLEADDAARGFYRRRAAATSDRYAGANRIATPFMQ